MKIVYAVGGLWTHHPGLQSKVLGATKVWQDCGHDVYLVLHSQGMLLDSTGNVIFSSDETCFSGRKIDYFDRSKSKSARLLSLRHQYRFLRQMLRRLNPDVVYTRYTLPFPGAHRNFSVSCPFVVEINSDDSVEYGIKSGVVGMANRVFRKVFLSKAAGLCFISQELSHSAAFAWYHGKTAVVSNSIDCGAYEFTGDTNNTEINLCFIGSPGQSWHGLDKVLLLAARFPAWRFHVIGPDELELAAACDELPKNLICHGYLNGQDARTVISGIDVGISTLALHKKKMREASPLKSRQYLAQGVPFISAYQDTDISDQDFVLQLENTQNNIEPELDRIRQFVERAYLDKGLRIRARRFAEQKLDVSVKEKERVDFIYSVID